MRTYSRDAWLEARAAWESFGPRWDRVRGLAAERGMLYPPSGSAHDDRDAAEPSQRAIVWRALEDNPTELVAIIGRSSSWSGVVDRIIGMESRLRTDADYRERDAEWQREHEPDGREATASLAAILGRIGDSL